MKINIGDMFILDNGANKKGIVYYCAELKTDSRFGDYYILLALNPPKGIMGSKQIVYTEDVEKFLCHSKQWKRFPIIN